MERERSFNSSHEKLKLITFFRTLNRATMPARECPRSKWRRTLLTMQCTSGLSFSPGSMRRTDSAGHHCPRMMSSSPSIGLAFTLSTTKSKCSWSFHSLKSHLFQQQSMHEFFITVDSHWSAITLIRIFVIRT